MAKAKSYKRFKPKGRSSWVAGAVGLAGKAWDNRSKFRQAFTTAKKLIGSTRVATKRKQTGGPSRSYTNRIKKGKKLSITRGTPGASHSLTQYIKLGNGPMKRVNVTFHHTYQRVISNVQGLQQVDWLNCIMGRLANNVGDTAVVSRNSKTDYGSNLFEMIPPYQTQGNFYQIGYPATVSNNRRLYVNDITSQLSVTNHSNIACHVEIYWVAPVKNQIDDPVTAWNKAIILERAGQQTQMTNQAAVAGTTVLSGYSVGLGYGLYDMNPRMTKHFKKLWNIKKYNHLKLGPGQIEDIVTHIKYGKSYSQAVDDQETSEFITGSTLVPMVIVKGQPVILKTAGETTYGIAEVGFIHKQIINLGVINDEQLRATRITNGILVNTGYTGGVIDEDGDATTNQVVT